MTALSNGLSGVASVAAAVTVWALAAGTALAPMPAQTTAPLSGPTGALAAAVFPALSVKQVLKWGTTFSGGPWIAPGTPCSVADLPPGEIAYLHIQALGGNRRCVGLNQPTVLGGIVNRPYPNPVTLVSPMVDGRGTGARVNVTPTRVIKWPVTYYVHAPWPVPGTPCSPSDMRAGESTTLHIQQYMAGSPRHRCVSNTLPIRER